MSLNLSKFSWNLTTPLGIKYKLIDRRGSFNDDESGEIVETLAMRTADLPLFIEEAFPQPTIVGGTLRYNKRPTSGNMPAFPVSSVQFQSFSGGKPIDPFGAHIILGFNAEHYDTNVLVTVTYRPNRLGDARGLFLDIRASASGEMIGVPVDGTGVWEAFTPVEPNESVRQQHVNATQIQAEADWTVIWSHIPFQFWSDTLKPLLEGMMGRVNLDPVDILFGSLGETQLFMGYQFEFMHTWRKDPVQPLVYGERPLVRVEMKFLEKNFRTPEGVIVTHNHFFKPGVGYRRLFIDGTNTVYATSDFNDIFNRIIVV